MVDLDPRRASGVSSSDGELKAAEDKAGMIYQYLQERGWQAPLIAQSGNGIHLLYKVCIDNTPESVKLMQTCLAALNMLFADKCIDVDLKTYNPARICKLYGTMAQKGSNTAERPHRMSKIIAECDPNKINDISLLMKLCDVIPKEEKPQKYNNFSPKEFDMDDFIKKHDIQVTQRTSWNGGTKWILDECPFDSSHKGKDASIIQTLDGKLCFNCFHSSCASNHWREFRQLYEPDAYNYVKETRNPNHNNTSYKPPKINHVKPTDGSPIFYTTEQIRSLKVEHEEFIKTGIEIIDKKMRGLQKGFVSVLSGLRACGKSSLISQLTIETVNQGYKAALFSGELTAKNTLDWLMLQAAGSDNVTPTQYENFYQVKESARVNISKWLDNKVFIYNNDYGNRFDEILQHIEKCVSDNKVDLVILDNLMALNISSLDTDKYQRQSLFVEQLESFAKRANIHIIFVAHPRKSNGFLRLDDISGSNDIVNRVDNAFIMHRVNEDFKRLSRDMFKWRADSELYECNNVLEICKDRRGGVQDEFIPLFFDLSSKRLKNYQYEKKCYDWQGSSGTYNFKQ